MVGHSQGEIAAAVVAGALSLEDGAKVVAVRARALRELAGTGAMASVGASAARVQEWLADGLSIATVNGPESVVVSGPPELVRDWVATLDVQTRVLDVDYASHGPMVEPIEASLRSRLADVRPGKARIGWLSTVTGRWMDGPEADGGYWYTNLREQVRFAPAVEALVADGHGVFLEASGHPVLTAGIGDIVPAASGTLRRDEPEWRQFLTAAGVLHCAGVGVDWAKLLGGPGRPVDLPTYAFEHQRYWLDAPGGDHPLLGPAVGLAAGGTVHTGRLSLAAQPWLADHAVGGTVLLPGSAMVELAVRAADVAGCAAVRELTLHAPLVIPERGAVELQVTVAEPDDGGTRELAVHARAGDDGEWTRHASAVLADDAAAAGPVLEAGSWPPAGAEPVDLDDFYDLVAAGGVAYGPAFRVLHAAWRAGGDVYAEVALPDGAAAGAFGLHPALLDGAAQAVALSNVEGRGMPFAWTGVRLHTTGADRLRVRIGKADDGGAAIAAADPGGRPVVSIESLVLRPAGEELRPSLTRGAMFRVDWEPVEDTGPGAVPAETWAVVGPGTAWRTAPVAAYHPPAGTTAEEARAAVAATLATVQDWLVDGNRLVVVTRGAVPAAGGDVTDLAGAAVWGLVRTVQTEHPGRIVLLDTDPGSDPDGPLPDAAVAIATASDESQLAVRGGALYAARLARATPPTEADPVWWGAGTVLVTGGTGALGAVVARHLAGAHGVRNLLLVSRSGPHAPGAGDLAAELFRLGAGVRVVAADVADRDALAAVLASIPAGRPLTAVVHAAGVVADGTVESLTGEHLERAFRAKAEGAWHLHELTRDLPLAAFVLFSSTSGVLGAAGMAGYAAANAYLDGLAHHRRRLGLPAASLAWGTWAEEGGMGGRLSATDRRRLARAAAPLSSPQALALLDAAADLPDPAPVLANLDLAALRAQLGADPAPPLLRRLLPPRRAGRAAPGAATGWAERLAAVLPADLPAVLLGLVREQAARILGHADATAMPADRTFSELGFDSLTAVELRNVLGAATGLRLPAALVFDHPNPQLLVEHLLDKLSTAAAEEAGAAEPTEAANPIAALYIRACEAGQYDEAWELARVVSRLAPSFDGPEDLPDRPGPVELTRGPATPVLFCFPSFSPASGVHEYTRFAAPLRDERRVLVVPEPGFVAGQSLPSTFDALVRLHADTVLRAADGAPFALLGRSASGWLAYSLAHHLEAIGAPPAAVVLLDTYFGEQQDRANLYSGARAMMAREQRSTMLSDVRVTAMGRYESLIAHWHPEPVRTPTLLVRATAPFSDEVVERTGGNWQASMSFAHDSTDVPGDHFSMLEDFAEATAAAVGTWLAATV
ncbi:SDR family NAD(P)-dependent oxidoreductase [Dactylosporangium sucinum]|uniref:SDR family NAD(P)-dependent oxidoreductase n=1 Tax=Dactylosporangium sucinum TaxID=1424081 RepID=UPI00227D5044|nr:SDR family NAD(P)-dependent oxidoreductase [Dactylosporangium sucinum]